MRKTDGTWRASERGRHVRGLKVTEGLLFTILWGGEHGDTVNTSLAQRTGLRPNWATIQPLPCRQTETRSARINTHRDRHAQTYSALPRTANNSAAANSCLDQTFVFLNCSETSHKTLKKTKTATSAT